MYTYLLLVVVLIRKHAYNVELHVKRRVHCPIPPGDFNISLAST